MKRTYKTPKAIQVDFRYDVHVKASSSGVALYGDPAERTSGVLNGPLNKTVCERYEQYVRAGILQIPQEDTCM